MTTSPLRCIDCGQASRPYQRPPAEPRCKACLRLRLLECAKVRCEEFKRKKLCCRCGEALSAHSIALCGICAAYHSGFQAAAMRQKRAARPEYRADEREKVRERMRKIRAEHHKAGLNHHGKPFKSAKTKAWSKKLSAAKRGQPFAGGSGAMA
jgi:hypothetical protein